jgi:hypothetical protein
MIIENNHNTTHLAERGDFIVMYDPIRDMTAIRLIVKEDGAYKAVDPSDGKVGFMAHTVGALVDSYKNHHGEMRIVKNKDVRVVV